MSEADVIARTSGGPHTLDSLAKDLASLGVTPGMALLVHSSLSSLGWVCGGAVTVILALERALGLDGTLVMPTHSGDLSDPAAWENPPVPESWWQTIRDAMPGFDPDLTPSRGVGLIPEVFRKQCGVVRSLHPNYSFAAWGREREYVTAGEKLDFGMDSDSPLGRLCRLDGHVLLLGVSHISNTSMHLAEYLANYPGKREADCFAPAASGCSREWTRYRDINLDCGDFEALGSAFEETGDCRTGMAGDATAKLMKQRDLVDFSVEWMQEHRR